MSAFDFEDFARGSFVAAAEKLGMPVVVTSALPIHPSPGEDGRRIVRHGMADVLAWLGEDVGAKPGAPTEAMLIRGSMYVSADFAAHIKAEVGR